MKTLGFGLMSLKKDPKWAMSHGIDPNNQTSGSVVGNAKANTAKGVDDRAKRGDVGGVNNQNANIFNQNQVNRVNPENSIFNQQKVGGADKSQSILDMMNKIDEQHKAMGGSNHAQSLAQADPSNNISLNDNDEMQKKLGKKLNIFA